MNTVKLIESSSEIIKKSKLGSAGRRMVLMERDFGFLKFCFEQKFLLRRQVSQWFLVNGDFNSNESCQRVSRKKLGIYKNNNLIIENGLSLNSTNSYTVSARGIKVLVDHGQIPEFSTAFSFDETTFNHDASITDVRLACQHLGLFKYWTPDWLLKLHNKEIIPDAHVDYLSHKSNQYFPLAIEIELSQKSKQRLRDIFYKYQISPYDLVLYFVLNQNLLEFLKKLAAECARKIYFCVLEDFLKHQLNSEWVNQFDSFKTEKLTKGENNG